MCVRLSGSLAYSDFFWKTEVCGYERSDCTVLDPYGIEFKIQYKMPLLVSHRPSSGKWIPTVALHLTDQTASHTCKAIVNNYNSECRGMGGGEY